MITKYATTEEVFGIAEPFYLLEYTDQGFVYGSPCSAKEMERICSADESTERAD